MDLVGVRLLHLLDLVDTLAELFHVCGKLLLQVLFESHVDCPFVLFVALGQLLPDLLFLRFLSFLQDRSESLGDFLLGILGEKLIGQ